MSKKILIFLGVLFIITIIITTLVLTNVLNVKFIALSFLLIGVNQIILGLYRKSIKQTYISYIIISLIMLMCAITFLFV